MAQVRTWVGLDVHAAKVVAAIADSQSGELAVRRLGGQTEPVAEFCAGLPALIVLGAVLMQMSVRSS